MRLKIGLNGTSHGQLFISSLIVLVFGRQVLTL